MKTRGIIIFLAFGIMLLLSSKVIRDDVIYNFLTNDTVIEKIITFEYNIKPIDFVYTPNTTTIAFSESQLDLPSESYFTPEITENVVEIIEPVTTLENLVNYSNTTGVELDIDDMLENPVEHTLSGEGVKVLIVHTHGCESYTASEQYQFTTADNDRTLDTNYNVMRIGEELCNILNENGIETMQIREFFDYPSYNDSYDRSLVAIEEALADNPSIEMVIDIHRDAIIDGSGERIPVTTEINGESAAQLMFVMGSDQGGLYHPNWENNVNFAVNFHNIMNNSYDNIMRTMLIKATRYNQHTTALSCLLEVGTSGNTLDEALYSITLFGNELAEYLK